MLDGLFGMFEWYSSGSNDGAMEVLEPTSLRWCGLELVETDSWIGCRYEMDFSE